MKRTLFAMLGVTALLLAGCKEDIDTSARYVFKEETIASYLEKHELYSQYFNLISEVRLTDKDDASTVRQLLSARGNYSVFAPTNQAIQEYLEKLVTEGVIATPDWDAFPTQKKRDSIAQVIVFNSIIDSGDDYDYYETATFPQRTSTSATVEFPLPNMNDRKLTVRYTDDPDKLYINDCLIDVIQRDILCTNGAIQAMQSVISPSNNSLGFLLKKQADNATGDFVVSSKLVDAVGLIETLEQVRDEEYEKLFKEEKVPTSSTNNSETFYTPEHRYFGFTYFAETDECWSRILGKPAKEITVDDVYDYIDAQGMYPEAKREKGREAYTKEDNLLYQFVTYHFLPERLSSERLVFHYNEKGYNTSSKNPTVPVMEFYTTMGARRLLKLYESRQSQGIYINRFPVLDNGRQGSYHEVSCAPENEGIKVGNPNLEGENDIRNGIVYPIDDILYYSNNTRSGLQKQRIRWNVTAMWPEFMNNDIRGSEITDAKHKSVYIPYDNIYKYLDDVTMSNETEFYYWTGRGNGWMNMQGDEMTIRGLTDCTMRLPPVPLRGTYELRFAIQCGGNMRGMVQFYWGSDPDRLAAMGIPIDLRQGAYKRYTSQGDIDSDIIGYASDTDDDDYNAEIDKRMRNNGYMKGCEQYCAGGPGTASMMRSNERCLRRIIIRQPMDPDKTYYIRFKTVMDDPTRFFYMDYLEYCSKEVYDNPETPEDIW